MELYIQFACRKCGEEVYFKHYIDDFNVPIPGNSNDNIGEDLITNDCKRCGDNRNIIVNYDVSSAAFFVANNGALLATDDD